MHNPIVRCHLHEELEHKALVRSCEYIAHIAGFGWQAGRKATGWHENLSIYLAVVAM